VNSPEFKSRHKLLSNTLRSAGLRAATAIMLLIPAFAHADVVELPIPIGNAPPPIGAPLCKAIPEIASQQEMFRLTVDKLREAVDCGELESAQYGIEELQYQLAEMQQILSTPRGFCYAKRGCQGGLIVNNPVPKNECDAAGGKSWKDGQNCTNL